MKTTLKTPFVPLLAAALLSLAAHGALAGTVTISSTPLATAGSGGVLPNLLFVLDASGSMDSDYLPDYVNDSGKCMRSSGGSTTCATGDVPWGAGGATGFNGVAYDPMVAYKPGLLSTGRSKLNNSTTLFGGALTTTAVPNDAYGVQQTGNSDITTTSTDARYCNSNSLCKRNGSDSAGTTLASGTDSQGVTYTAGQFPYKTHASNSSTLIMGLPEMMQMGTLSRSGNAVTVNTTAAHGLAASDTIYVTGTGDGTMDRNAVVVATVPTTTRFTYTSTASGTFPALVGSASFTRAGGRVTVTSNSHGLTTDDFVIVSLTGNANIDIATPVQVSVTGSNTFTYNLSGSVNVAAVTGSWQRAAVAVSFRKHTSTAVTVARVALSSTVTVTSTAHGLVNNDVVLVDSTVNNTVNSTGRSVTVINANSFSYTQTGGTTTVIASAAATWVRTGLYNSRGTQSGTPNSFYIVPVEYCSDANLSNCTGVAPGASAPAGFPFAAHVRFCQTQEQALAPGAVSDASGTPRCRSKFVGSGGTLWTWPRYGVFKRDIIQVGATFARAGTRIDCVNPAACTYTEEIQNYARWYTYYRTRMQMMKTAAGRAFLPFISNPSATPSIPDKLRIGFITINPFYAIGSGTNSGTIQANRYLKISEFNTTHASNWYTMFYLQDPSQSTPLREALSRAGWIYAGKLNTGLTDGIPVADDPVQEACQRHFTLLTTDGYWNGNAGQNLQGTAIGNYDNVNPTTDSGYSQVAVDRGTTGTFDGGVGTQVQVDTPTTQLEQVICLAGNTTFGGGAPSACGCSAGQHRIKQRTTTTTQSTVTIDGIVTSTSPGTPAYTYQNISACSPVFTQTQTTPANRLEQQICSGSANTTFSQGTQQACGCGTNLKRVKQQTGNRNHVVVSTDGAVTSDTYTAYTYTFQNITPVCNALISTTVTEITETEDNRCQGNSNTSFGVSANNAAGGETACGCTGSNRRNWRRTITYDHTVITHDGVTTTNSYGGIKTQAFAQLTGCTNPAAPSNTPNYATSAGPTTTTSGATVAPPTLSPNPQINDPNGAMVPTQSGTQLTITLTPNPGNPTVGTPTTTTTPGGYQNTLADVAMYYFRNDLRGGTEIYPSPQLVAGAAPTTGPARNLGGTGTKDVSSNIVPAKSGAKDFVTHQHMVTFSIGLADGLMRYQADYDNPATTTGDFANVKSGTGNACFWVSGTCNWPQPIQDDASALDDLWHAAVNGRGQFYLALNADALSTGIQTALTAVNAQVAAAAASATSSPNVTQTDNQIFSTTYETNTWSGKVFSQTIDPATGDVLGPHVWEADQQLLGKVSTSTDSRVIWTFDGTSGSLLKDFVWARLTAAEQAFFLSKCVPASTMAQCTALTAPQLVIANDGSSLLGFLRGQLGNEGTIFRDRTYIDLANNSAVVQTVLGDTISAKPAYLRKTLFNYADAVTPTYASFASANLLRSPRVYVAANDGYLHAFHGDTGEEMWAYLPRFLMPGLYQLADTGYATGHRYYADGSPELGEVYDGTAGAWKSILVAGVSGGGRGFYALDVTDPSNPKGLWEFCSDATVCAISDPDLGLSYGNAIIGKRALDQRWVVIVTSGLNNIGPGDGVGHFYVLDAITGAVLDKVATTAGTLGTPSGLMKMSAFYDSALTDATFRYIYAGDQLGNVWRLDTRTNPPTVLRMARLTDNSTPTPRAQPITTRPRLTPLNGYRVMFFGTGRYLGSPDLSDPTAASGISWQQTMWAFKDKDADYGDLRTDTNMVQQVLAQASLGATDRTITANPVNWNTKDGWYVDFNPQVGGVDTTPGEGVNVVDPVLIQGTVLVITNTPASGGSSCSVGGSSAKYEFDFKTGGAVGTSAGGVVGRSLGGTITVGVAVVQLPSGAIKAITTGADTSKTTSSVNVSASSAAVRRFSYRIR